MNDLKPNIDLREFVVPTDNLIEPEQASRALILLNNLVVENAGTKMGFLYEDLIEECLVETESQYRSPKQRAEHKEPLETIPTAPPVPEAREKYIEQRKQKGKTRPFQTSAFKIVALPEEKEILKEEQLRLLKVEASTARIFTTLFESRNLVVVWTGQTSCQL